MDLKKQLKTFFKGNVQDDEAVLAQYSHDASLFEVKPRVVVFPQDAEDIKNLVSFVSHHQEDFSSGEGKKLSLTCRSGGSDMTGGPLSESIVVDMGGLNHIGEIVASPNDASLAYGRVEPGVFYRDFEKETLKKNLLLPSFPASRELCTVGGMVANNSGGEKTLLYGKTENYIQELEVILSDGNQYIIKPLSMAELEEKKKLQNFEGELYRKTHRLIEENYDILQNAKPKVSKNSAGYFLWNVWDREKRIFDLTKLFVGSQGTLGIVDSIKFRLVKPSSASALLIIFLPDLKLLAEATNAVLAHKPETFESYDDHTLKFAIAHFPDFLKTMKENIFSLALQFVPEFFMLLRGGIPKLILLAEFTGNSKEETLKNAREAEATVRSLGAQTRIAKDEKEAKKYITIRRESFNLLRHHVRGKRTAPFIDDIIVRAEDLEEFLPKLQEILNQYPELVYTIAGHVGDGNLHIIPLMNLEDPRSREIIPELAEKVYGLVLQFKGSLTAEHNDGIFRTPYLTQMYGQQVCDIFLQVKRIFDPNNIFNPGKKVNGSLEYALSHIVSH